MEKGELIDEISKIISIPTTKYKGVLLGNQRYGKGKEMWEQEKNFNNQEYTGKFVYDSLHGPGDYTWNIDNQKKVYEGLFYSSKLEGYGRISNNDNSYFEGLFRKSSRFGPGVVTNANGTQDVGMWYGKHLMRLCVIVKPEWLPRLAHSAKAKVHLLRYKTLVRICDDVVDYAKVLLNNIDANDEVTQQSHQLYNTFVRHPKSLFFNAVLYDNEYFSSKDCFIEIAADPNELLFNTPKNEKNTDTGGSTFCIKAKNDFSGQSFIRIRIKELKDDITRIDKDILKFEEVCQTIAELEKKNQLEIVRYLDKEKKNVGWDLCQLISDKIDAGTLNDFFDMDLKNYDSVYTENRKALNAMEDAIKILKIKKKNLQDKVKYEESQLKNPVSIPKQYMKKVFITDLLAWNNEEMSINMMKHAFLHRNFERTVSFCVAKLLSGNRSEFKAFGNYERDCIEFLSECSNGNFYLVSDLLTKYDLNPDMCDAGGNTGIMFAAARDRHTTIKTIVNFGGNVDAFNDECVTPLSLCVLRYLAVQNDISNWETAFLFPTYRDEYKDLNRWRQQSSVTTVIENGQNKQVATIISDSTSSSRFKLEALSDVIGSTVDILEADFNLTFVQLKLESMVPKNLQETYLQNHSDTNQVYLFNVECVYPPLPKKSNSKNKIQKTKIVKKESVIVDKKLNSSAKDILLQDKLRVIYETITILLDFGADTNITEVPMPILLMALFTKNVLLVEDLLLKKANPNATTAEKGLTGLHILVSLPPCEVLLEEMQLLIKYEANPHLKANVEHWVKEKEELIGNHTLENVDLGKMPLHLLAMRFDFQSDVNDYLCKMAKILIKNGALPNKRYLGHVPLSLAVLRGNVKLIRTLLETGKVNPNCILGEQMGVPLTVYTLKRYTLIPPLNECVGIIRMLEQFGANPFNSTGERGNVIEFLDIEREIRKKESLNKKPKKRCKHPKPKKEPKPKLNLWDQIKLVIENVAEDVLLRHIKGWVLKYLYHFTESQDYYDETAERIAKFINVAESILIMQIIFHRGEIPIDKVKNYQTLYDLIEFIINANYPSNERSSPTSFNVDIHKLLENFEFKKLPTKPGYLNLPQPEVDEHSEKYIVCFYCYKRLNCQLFKCTKCKLIYYCSEQCNLLGIKFKSATHKCNLDFYASSKQAFDDKKSCVESFESEHELPPMKRYIKPDQKRRLHLTRNQPSEIDLHAKLALLKPVSLTNIKNKDAIEPVRKISNRPIPIPKKTVPLKLKLKIPGTKAPAAETHKRLYISNCEEIKRRLPKKYQCFLEKIVEFWPDLDLSMLFLPYACYSNGELYYRFDIENPVFAGTYSIL